MTSFVLWSVIVREFYEFFFLRNAIGDTNTTTSCTLGYVARCEWVSRVCDGRGGADVLFVVVCGVMRCSVVAVCVRSTVGVCSVRFLDPQSAEKHSTQCMGDQRAILENSKSPTAARTHTRGGLSCQKHFGLSLSFSHSLPNEKLSRIL